VRNGRGQGFATSLLHHNPINVAAAFGGLLQQQEEEGEEEEAVQQRRRKKKKRRRRRKNKLYCDCNSFLSAHPFLL
jgi:hypothetical protein